MHWYIWIILISYTSFALLLLVFGYCDLNRLNASLCSKVIGIIPNDSSLQSYGINYKYINLIDNNFDYEKIKENVENVKVIHIQRSIGYDNRNTISVEHAVYIANELDIPLLY